MVAENGSHRAGFTVRFVDAGGQVAGLGVLVGPDRVVTCPAVVTTQLGSPAGAPPPVDRIVTVTFPQSSAPGEPRRAQVTRWAPERGLAALVLVDPEPPPGAVPAVLPVEPPPPGTTVHFRAFHGNSPDLVKAAISGQATPAQLQLDPLAPGAPPVDTGSPVYDAATGSVAGLLLPRQATEAARKLIAAAEIHRFWPEAFTLPRKPDSVDLVQLSDLRVGDPEQDDRWLTRLSDDVVRQIENSGSRPDLLVVTGDLTASGEKPQLERAFDWLAALAETLQVDRPSVLVVPGERDVSTRLRVLERERAVLLGRPYVPPYPTKWSMFAAASARFHQDTGVAPFNPERPWSLSTMPGKRVVVAALNSTMSLNDRESEDTGEVTAAQIEDLGARLVPYRDRGWLRLGIVHHNPAALARTERLQDAERVTTLLGTGLISLLLHGHAGTDRNDQAGLLGAGGRDRQYHLVRIDPDRYLVQSRDFGAQRWGWTGDPMQTCRDFGLRPGPDDGAERAATDEFRRRVRAAVEVRVPDAPVEETGLPGGSLFRAGGLTVRALHGPVSRQDVEDVAADARTAPPGRVTIVHSGPPPGADLLALARDRGVQLSTRPAYQMVVDLTAARQRQRDLVARDPRHVAEHYVPQGFHLVGSAGTPTQADDLAAEIGAWFAEDTAPLIVVAGAAGSGKSALLHRLVRELAGTTPLLIDLSQAEQQATSIDALLVRSLLNLGVTDLRLDRLRYLVAEGQLALLLDGLDDLARRAGWDAAGGLLGELVRTTTPYSKVVLTTCDPTRGADLARSRTVELDEFTADRAEQYLTLRLGTGAGPWAGPVVEPLSRNPRCLVLLAGLGPDRLRAAAAHRINRSTLYRDLVEAWARDEAARWPGPDGRPSTEQWKRQRTRRALQVARQATADGAHRAADPLVDWLVAEAVAAEIRAGAGDTLLRSLRLTPLACELLVEIAEAKVRAWAGGDHRADSIAGANAVAVQERLDDGPPSSACAESPDDGDSAAAAALREDVLTGRVTGEIQSVVGGTVQCLAYGDGGRLLAVGRGDVVEIVDRPAGRVVRRLARHSSTVRGVTFHAGDRYVISASDDGTIYMWEAATGTFVHEFAGHQKAVTAVTVSRPANLLVSASADGTLRTWNPDTGRPEGRRVLRRQFRNQPSNEFSAIAADPTRPVVIAGTQDYKAIAWDVVTGEQLFELEHHDSVTAVAFAPDGSFVTTTNGGRAIRWDGSGGAPEQLLAAGSALTCVALSPDGDLIAVGRRTGELQLKRLRDGRDWQSWVAHVEPVTAVTFPANGNQVTTVGEDGMVKTWSVRTGRLVRELESDTYWATGLAFHDRGDERVRLAASTWDGAVTVWNLPDGTTEAVLGKRSGALNGVAFAPDGDRILAGQLLDPPVAYVWRLSTGHQQELSGHYDGLTAVAFAPDGRFIATVAEDHSFMVWDDTGKPLHRRPDRRDGERSEPVTCLAFRPRDAMLAIGHGHLVRMWDPATGEEFPDLRLEHGRTLNAVAFVSSTDKIVTATRDNLAWIWDLSHPQRPFAKLEGHTGSVNCVAVSPNGELAATGSSDNTARIFWTRNGELNTTLTGHAGGLTAVAFSPNGQVLATAARDNTIRLWNIVTDEVIATFYLLRDGASVMVRGDGAYRTHGDPGTGVWWVSGLCRVRLDELRPGGAGPRPLTDGETLIPAELSGR